MKYDRRDSKSNEKDRTNIIEVKSSKGIIVYLFLSAFYKDNINENAPSEKVVVKGRGVIKKDYSSSLLGWADEDYDQINKRLYYNGKRFKDSFYKRQYQQKEVGAI